MPPLITVFDERGEVKTVTPTTFHLIGKGSHEAIEIKISDNSVVEVPLNEICSQLHLSMEMQTQ